MLVALTMIYCCLVQAFLDRASSTTPDKQPFASSIDNFYMTDVISRSSQTMAKCVQARGTMPQ